MQCAHTRKHFHLANGSKVHVMVYEWNSNWMLKHGGQGRLFPRARTSANYAIRFNICSCFIHSFCSFIYTTDSMECNFTNSMFQSINLIKFRKYICDGNASQHSDKIKKNCTVFLAQTFVRFVRFRHQIY